MKESSKLNGKKTGKKQSSIKDLAEQNIYLKNKIEELKRSEERYHKMIEEVEDYAILLLDVNGIVQNWNKGAEKIKGYKDEEIIGKSFRIFYLPEDREKRLPEKLIEEAIRSGKALHEGWRLRKDGTRFWGSIVITALHDDHANIIGFSKVTRDLTNIKIATDQIKENARDLEFQNKELQQFTYAAAHDLKEPLRKVQFYNSSILEKLSDKLPEKEKTYLNNSISSVVRMRNLIDDLLLYSETTSVSAKFEVVDIRPMLEEVSSFYQESIGEGSLDLELGDSTEIWGIPYQLRQLFDNLVGNSVKYHAQDRQLHITISCNKEYHQFIIESVVNPVRYYIKITVRDNGIGFEPESAHSIFELFYRLHGRAEYPGTGVGLAICKKIVQNHKGIIEASSKPGEGSVFTVFLPST